MIVKGSGYSLYVLQIYVDVHAAAVNNQTVPSWSSDQTFPNYYWDQVLLQSAPGKQIIGFLLNSSYEDCPQILRLTRGGLDGELSGLIEPLLQKASVCQGDHDAARDYIYGWLLYVLASTPLCYRTDTKWDNDKRRLVRHASKLRKELGSRSLGSEGQQLLTLLKKFESEQSVTFDLPGRTPKGRAISRAIGEVLYLYEAIGGDLAFPHKGNTYEGGLPTFLRFVWRHLPTNLRPPSVQTFIDYARKMRSEFTQTQLAVRGATSISPPETTFSNHLTIKHPLSQTLLLSERSVDERTSCITSEPEATC